MDIQTLYFLPSTVICAKCGQKHSPTLAPQATGAPFGIIRCERCKHEVTFRLPELEAVKTEPVHLEHNRPV